MKACDYVRMVLDGLDIRYQDFAAELGVERTHFSHVLSGRRKFSKLLARVVAASFKARKIKVSAAHLEAGEVPDQATPTFQEAVGA